MNAHTVKTDPAIIKALAAEGHSQSSIAAMLGVSRERIRQICKRDGIKTLPGYYDYDLSDKMRACAERGLTLTEAARELGRSLPTIYYKAKREGIVFPEPKYRWHEIRDAAAEGLTIRQCAKRMGWSYQNVWTEAKEHGIEFPVRKASRQSAVKGVFWFDRESRWRATITRNGKQVYLGSFVLEEDAIAARKAAEAQQ